MDVNSEDSKGDWKICLIPIGVLSSIAGIVWFCVTHVSSCYGHCDEPLPAPGKYDIAVIGSVKTLDGETCRVEQVDWVHYDYNTLNEEKRCYGPGEGWRKPMVRRIVCLSGKNGESNVGVEGGKMKHEVIQ